jgi:DNA-binding LacI/PurR family transcriptional regulator
MPRLSRVSAIQGYAKYKQAKQSICQHIIRTGAKPGDKVCTEAVLIKELGISVTTVRRALEELVREGILVRRVGKGTFFKGMRPKSETASSTVLVLGYNSWQFLREDVYFGRIVGALGEKLRQADLRQVVLINEWGTEPEAEIEDVRRHNPAAIVFPYVSSNNKAFLLAMATLGVPLMVYGHPVEGVGAGQVFFDEYRGGAEVAEHLMSRGHRDMGVISLPVESPAGQARYRGFIETVLASPDHRIVADVAAPGFAEADGYQAVAGLLEQAKPDAIFCCGDLLAYGAIKKLDELGLSVPRDIAVAGYGDFEVSTFYHPRLTTVQLDLAQMGVEIGQWVAKVTSVPTGTKIGPFIRKLAVKLIVRDTA